MTFEQFIKKWTGKPIDFDGIYPNQCFDLAHQYIYDVLGIKDRKIISHPSAYQIFTNFNQNGIDAKYFTKIKNTPLGIPQKGDLIIWGQGAGSYGHVAIFVDGDINWFTSFDANWPTGTLPHKVDHSYNNVIGWLRPKEESMGEQSPELKACLVMHTQLVDETVKLKQELEDVRAEFKAATEDFKRDKERLENESEARNKEYKNFLADVAIAIGSTQNESQVLAVLKGLIKNDEDAQRAIDTLREEEVTWNKAKLFLEGEILKLQQQIKSKDLADQDIETLLRAIVRRLITIVRSR